MITLRPAEYTDAPFLWELANEPVVRWASGDRPEIKWPDHLAWFTERLIDPDCRFWIAERGPDEPVGQLREDLKDGCTWVSLAVSANERGRGVGRTMLGRLSFGGPYRAKIREGNLASLAAFAANGFHVERQEDGWVWMVRP